MVHGAGLTMPQVPIYQSRQVKDQPLATPTQRAPDVSSDLNKVAGGMMAVGDLATQIVQRDAQDEAWKIENQIRSDWNQYRSQLRNQYKADQADQYKAAADDWWEKAKTTYGANANPAARRMASRSIGQYMLQAESDTLGYVEGEKRKSREINFRTLQDDIIRDAGQTVSPENATAIVSTAAKRIRENAIAYATTEGLSGDVGERMAREQLDRFHAEVALSLANKPNGAEAAQKYLAEFGKEIPLAARTKIDEVVTKEADNQFATQFATQQAGKPLAEQLKAAGELTNPDRREKAIQQIRLNHALVKEAKREVEEGAADNAWQLFSQNKKIPEAILSAMDGKERSELVKAQAARAERLAGGKAVKTDPKSLAQIYDMMRDEPDKFKTLRMSSLIERVSPSDMEQISRIQRDMLKPDTEKDVITSAQLIGTYTRGMNDERKSGFEQSFYGELLKFKENNKGRNPNDKEKQAIADDLMLRRDNAFFEFGTKYKFQMTPEEAAKAKFDGKPPTAPAATTPTRQKPASGTIYNISGGDRSLIMAALKAEGMPPTEDNIQARYRLVKGLK